VKEVSLVEDDPLSLAIIGVKEELQEFEDDEHSEDWNDGYRQGLQDTIDRLSMLQRSLKS
jgi:hypothetical protein